MIMHPLGAGAEPGRSHKTAEARRELLECIRLYWNGAFERMNSATEGYAGVGMKLARPFVSALEVANALEELKARRPSCHRILELIYVEEWTREQVAQAIHMDGKTLRKRIDEGLDLMIERIWRE